MRSCDIGYDAQTVIELRVQLQTAALHPEGVAEGGIGARRVIGYSYVQVSLRLSRYYLAQ